MKIQLPSFTRPSALALLTLSIAPLACAQNQPAPTALAQPAQTQGATRPNILWLTFEDTSPYEYPAYGNRFTKTPNLDKLATGGIVFDKAWASAPYCSPARSSLISGRYASTMGTDRHREARTVSVDNFFFPTLLREAGYFTSNKNKRDYNNKTKIKNVFDAQGGGYDSPNRRPGQPFFSIYNSMTSHMSVLTSVGMDNRRDFAAEGLDPAKLDLPPHVPDLPAIRSDYAQHLESVGRVDQWVGTFVADLKEKNLSDDTIIFVFSDHGGCLPRGKAFLYETGLQVPLWVYVPPKWRKWAGENKAGSRNEHMVNFVDFGPTVLSLAGLPVPSYMQGQAFLGPQTAPPRQYNYAFRYNQSDSVEPERAISDGRNKYIRFYSRRHYEFQRNGFQWQMPSNIAWDEAAIGKRNLPPKWMRYYLPKPNEKLFDLQTDKWEMTNLASDAGHVATKRSLSAALSKHLRDTRDIGFFCPSEREAHKDLLAYVRARPAVVNELIDAAELAARCQTSDIPQLRRMLQSAEPSTRYWAANGLADLAFEGHLKTAPPELLVTSADAASDVRAISLEAMTYMGDRAALQQLIAPEFKPINKNMLLETLTLSRPALFEGKTEMLTAGAANNFDANGLLVNLGVLPASDLFPPAARTKALKINTKIFSNGPTPGDGDGGDEGNDDAAGDG